MKKHREVTRPPTSDATVGTNEGPPQPSEAPLADGLWPGRGCARDSGLAGSFRQQVSELLVAGGGSDVAGQEWACQEVMRQLLALHLVARTSDGEAAEPRSGPELDELAQGVIDSLFGPDGSRDL